MWSCNDREDGHSKSGMREVASVAVYYGSSEAGNTTYMASVYV